MYKALTIAKWFLNYDRYKNMSDESEGISNLKLQKLLYYAQGTYLALTDNALFKEPIYAWMHGPVVPEVYHEYKNFGANNIDFDEDFDISQFNIDDTAILEEVYDVFGQYSAWKLREMTHEETPYKTTHINEIITHDKIKSFFKAEWVA